MIQELCMDMEFEVLHDWLDNRNIQLNIASKGEHEIKNIGIKQ